MGEFKDLAVSLQKLCNMQDKGITIIKTLEEEKFVSYKQLWERALLVVRKLEKMGACRGCEIVIQCRDMENYLYAFWGSVLGGYIAVPIDVSNNEYKSEVNKKIFNRLGNPFLVYDDMNNSNVMSDMFIEKALDVTSIKDVIIYEKKTEYIIESSADDVVYIQFSSGTTGEPKGAILRKRNISCNCEDIIDRLQLTHEDRFLSWQPLTHCYGLIVFHIIPVILGVSHHLIATDVFIRFPIIWLKKADELKSTRLGTLPFGLKHFIDFYNKSLRDYEWDLSNIKSITIGGEQVSFDLCNQFTKMLEKHKISPIVMKPIYGLAEATTCLSLLDVNQGINDCIISSDELEIGTHISSPSRVNEKDCISYIYLGEILKQVKIQIVDDNKRALPDRTIGYILAKGDNVTDGYYNDPDATRMTIQTGQWFDTGDIGFVDNNKLVVLGRSKELVIINGKKYSCIAIENIINNDEQYGVFGKIVVTSGKDSENYAEQMLVFIEMSDELKNKAEQEKFIQLSKKIKEHIFKNVGIVVNFVIPIENIPKTYSGKIRRKELTKKFNNGAFNNIILFINEIEKKLINGENMEIKNYSKDKVKKILINIIANLFDIRVDNLDLAFKDYGIVSVNIPAFISEVNRIFKIDIKIAQIFSFPSINDLADYIYELISKKETSESMDINIKQESIDDEKIAIIGMSCRLPGGANSIKEYWDLLIEGRDGICDVPENRWNLEKYYDEDDTVPGKMYCKKGGFMDILVDEFDARFFNISPKEANALDPQQRLLLELTWEAFENANMDITKYSGSNTGVFIGMSTTEYTLANLYSGDLNQIDAYSLTGTCMSTACGRVSYTFGFEGPCLAIDTACSSSLSALHVACLGLKNREMDMGVVGGVNMMLSPAPNIGFSKLHATAKDGHCKSFDADANGYGRSEGGGIILLKRLSDAIKDGDDILGVIVGTGINQDGKSNGLTAPNGASQVKLIEQTVKRAQLSMHDIDYVEMHGTGTKLGDPIEVGAIGETYAKGRDSNEPLMIGTVKSNIGHLEAAAGVTSIIKVILSLQHDMIPANLNFNTPNPLINWSELPIKVITRHTQWKKKNGVRRAGINGFGFGGSNAHVIIEEYKKETVQIVNKDGIDYVLKLSAKTKNALQKYVDQYIRLLQEENNINDVIYSANTGRADFEYRLAVVGKNKEEIINGLREYTNGNMMENVFCNLEDRYMFKHDRKIVFMFTGQGSQYVNMGRFLFETNEVFKDAFLLCDRLFKPMILKSIVDLLYSVDASDDVIERTVYAQPLIFAIEYSLALFWKSIGVKPEIVMGHSIGEYAAAVVANIISLEDAVKLVSIRGRLMDSAPGVGTMGTIFANEKIVENLIASHKDKVSIAAHNTEETCVISGDLQVVEEILESARKEGIRVKKLKVSHGFHSQLMEPILNDFEIIANEITYKVPSIRFVSALYADEINNEKIIDASYWTKHIRDKVDFYGAIKSIEHDDEYCYLEIGSSRVLAALCTLIYGNEKIIATSLNRKRTDQTQLAHTIALLYIAGVNINWNKVQFTGKSNWEKVSLPTYPFDRVSYWNELLYDRKIKDNTGISKWHRLLGEKLETPFMEDGVIFQSKFDAVTPYFMQEHIIFETPISPAAAHISMMLSAVEEVRNPRSCTLKEIEFRRPLAISEGEDRQVQIYLDGVSKSESNFNIVSRTIQEKNSKWITHAKGQIIFNKDYVSSSKFSDKLDIDLFKNINFTSNPEQGIYDSMKKAGFKLGDSFRRILKTEMDGEGCVSFISPLKSVPDMDKYVLYPGIIDSIIQTALNPVLDQLYIKYGEESFKNIRTTIPYYMEKLTYNYKQSHDLWCYTVAHIQGDMVVADIIVLNENNEQVMIIENSMVKITNQENLLKELKNNYNHLWYHTNWIKEDIPESQIGDQKYIVLLDSNAGEVVCQELKLQNVDVIQVMQASEYRYIDGNNYLVDYTSKEQIKELLEKIVFKNNSDKFKIVYAFLGNDAQLEIKDLQNSIEYSSLKGLFYLVQVIDELRINNRVKLKIVTKNTQTIGDDEIINLNQASIWGLAKVIAHEYPEIFEGIIDIDKISLEGEVTQLINEIKSTEEKEVCLRQNKNRYVNKLIQHKEYIGNQQKQLDSITIDSEGVYLITGATGTVGMTYAQYLAGHGAKKILFMCRKYPNDLVIDEINSLEQSGVEIELLLADVCNYSEVEKVLANYKNISGVIHAAGVLNDKMLKDLDWDEFEYVLNPKIKGTLNVCRAVNFTNIDFFIMLSSITSILGNMGQANYASANYFMNSLANYMKQKGVHGYAVCWGPWLNGGMASGNDAITKNLDASGIKSFPKDTALKIIEELFDNISSNIVVLDIDWNKYEENIDSKNAKQLIKKLVLKQNNIEKHGENTNNDTILIQLRNAKEEDRLAVLTRYLQQACAKIMGFGMDEYPDVDTSFREQGADSLMIFSIRSTINKALDVEINVSAFYNYPTITKLAEYLINELLFMNEIDQSVIDKSTEDLLNELKDLAF